MMDTFYQFVNQANKPFQGWNFSFLTDTGRLSTEPLPWNYASIVLQYMYGVDSMLDMGTGGGEFLSLLTPLPARTAATEGYAPNIPLAKERLEPLGISVHAIEDDTHLPFANEQFDLIINKHESFCEKEVKRVLKPNGIFITQQVGGLDNLELNDLLHAYTGSEYSYWNMEYASSRLKHCGFQILKQQECFPYQRFYDIGSIIYYLKAIPWQIPDFSVSKYEEQLLHVHNHIQQNGFIEVKAHRFYIVASL
ncbi:class I SAM-dependent methyltransferase [Bacillus cereus]|uniref:class I SAM-dependent methyltransferase n=1 Tax=Bacillus sp. 491mf TaxID=1761755 RepID=UPI000B81AB47|nr:class I SAM-dependent methyltransferase [Bacillus sp. 491mf]